MVWGAPGSGRRANEVGLTTLISRTRVVGRDRRKSELQKKGSAKMRCRTMVFGVRRCFAGQQKVRTDFLIVSGVAMMRHN